MTDTRKPLTARAKVSKLNKILAAHAGWERRTLADLRVAGFSFTTVEQAQRYMQAQRTLAALSHDELIEQVARMQDNRSTNKEAGQW